MGRRVHIDDAQPATVEEHERLLLEDRSLIEPRYTEITPDDLPEWFNEKLFKSGQAYYMRNLASMGCANMIGLIAILSIPDILKILIFTDQSSSTCTAFKRYAQTLLHMYNLYYSDVTDTNSKWYKSLNVIRWKHAVNSKRAEKPGLVGIYQKDMAITQYAFIGFIITRPTTLGLSNKPEERDAFNHFWRVTGHMLGISDCLNVCRKTVAETTELCERISYNIIAKHMNRAEPEFLNMSTYAIEGLWHVDMGLDTDALIALTYNLAGSKYQKTLSWYTRMNMKFRENLFYLFTVPYIGFLAREYYNYLLMASYWILEHYPVVAWMAFGKRNSKICLYPKLK